MSVIDVVKFVGIWLLGVVGRVGDILGLLHDSHHFELRLRSEDLLISGLHYRHFQFFTLFALEIVFDAVFVAA